MKHFPFLLVVLCARVALAQPVPPLVEVSSEAIDRERARIETQRQSEEARFVGEEAACYQRFAVNDCLREVRARRRALLEDLRRQEIELNDEQRRKRVAERLRRLGEGPSAAPLPDPSAVRPSESAR